MHFHIIGGYGKLVAIGGYNALNDVDVIDLSGQGVHCQSWHDYPYRTSSFGTFMDGEVLVCGGYNGNAGTVNCFTYDYEVKIN